MIYINAYAVVRAYGGREEGGWYYDVGEPIASIPIPTQREKGQTYYMEGSTPIIQTCRYCEGTGQVEGEVDSQNDHLHDVNFPPLVRCEDCGEIPVSAEWVRSNIESLKVILADDIVCREELRICVEKKFAEAFPSERPSYE